MNDQEVIKLLELLLKLQSGTLHGKIVAAVELAIEALKERKAPGLSPLRDLANKWRTDVISLRLVGLNSKADGYQGCRDELIETMKRIESGLDDKSWPQDPWW